MTFPPCPVCQKGHLLPVSRMQEANSFWVCSAPECDYVISGNRTAVKFFKGNATHAPNSKGEKEWTEFEF